MQSQTEKERKMKLIVWGSATKKFHLCYRKKWTVRPDQFQLMGEESGSCYSEVHSKQWLTVKGVFSVCLAVRTAGRSIHSLESIYLPTFINLLTVIILSHSQVTARINGLTTNQITSRTASIIFMRSSNCFWDFLIQGAAKSCQELVQGHSLVFKEPKWPHYTMKELQRYFHQKIEHHGQYICKALKWPHDPL